jgi:hypothetical protein
MANKKYTKVTVYISNCHYEDEDITKEKRIAQIIKDRISDLGEVEVYYENRYENLSWWQKFMKSMGGG